MPDGANSWRPIGRRPLRSMADVFGWTKDLAVDMGPMGVYQVFAIDGVAAGGMMNRPPNVSVPFWNYYFQVDGIAAAATPREILRWNAAARPSPGSRRQLDPPGARSARRPVRAHQRGLTARPAAAGMIGMQVRLRCRAAAGVTSRVSTGLSAFPARIAARSRRTRLQDVSSPPVLPAPGPLQNRQPVLVRDLGQKFVRIAGPSQPLDESGQARDAADLGRHHGAVEVRAERNPVLA